MAPRTTSEYSEFRKRQIVAAAWECFHHSIMCAPVALLALAVWEPTLSWLDGAEGSTEESKMLYRQEEVSFSNGGIKLAGTGLPGETLFLAQQRAISRAEGATEAEWREDLADLQKFVGLIRARSERADLEPVIRAMLSRKIDRQMKEAGSAVEMKSAELDSIMDCILSGYNTPWFRSFLDHDPRTAPAKVKCPVLIVFGELDSQLPLEENRNSMVQELLKGNCGGFPVKTFPRRKPSLSDCDNGKSCRVREVAQGIRPGIPGFHLGLDLPAAGMTMLERGRFAALDVCMTRRCIGE